MRAANLAVSVGVCLLLAFGVLAFGAVQAWAVLVLEVGSARVLLWWAADAIAFPEVRIARSSLFLPMLLLACLVAVQLVLAHSAYWYATWQKALLWAAYGMLFFLGTQCFRREAELNWVAVAATSFGFLLAIFSIAQEFAGNGKIYWLVKNQGATAFFGPYANHAHYAGLMEMLVPFPLVLAMGRFSPVPIRMLYSCAAVVMGSSILLSRSRGGIIAFAVEVGLLTLIWGTGGGSRRRLLSVGLFCLLLCVCLVLVRPNGLLERFMQIGEPTDRAHSPSRITMLEDSFRMLRQRPILGWGLGTFAVVYPSFRSFYSDLTVNAAHNDFAELAVETGLVGLVLALIFIYRLYRSTTHGTKQWDVTPRGVTVLAALVACTGLLVHSFSDFNLAVPANAAVFVFMAAIAASGSSEIARDKASSLTISRQGQAPADWR